MTRFCFLQFLRERFHRKNRVTTDSLRYEWLFTHAELILHSESQNGYFRSKLKSESDAHPTSSRNIFVSTSLKYRLGTIHKRPITQEQIPPTFLSTPRNIIKSYLCLAISRSSYRIIPRSQRQKERTRQSSPRKILLVTFRIVTEESVDPVSDGAPCTLSGELHLRDNY